MVSIALKKKQKVIIMSHHEIPIKINIITY